MNKIIEVKNFSKSFGKKKVIEDLSFEVYEGEIFAFLGANGSGKTTTIRSLLGIYGPDSGELLINGEKYNTGMSSLIGYLPEERGLYTSSRVLETMIYLGQLRGLTADEARNRARDYLSRVELADKENVEIKKLSSGQQQKIQLGVTIINRPKLLILDEPTKGLDPVNRKLLLDVLLELNKEGSTIIFSTHQMEEAERIANRILMIKDGKSALYGDLANIKESYGSNEIFVTFKGEFPSNEKMYEFTQKNGFAEIIPKESNNANDILNYLIKQDVVIEKFELAKPSLNDIFLLVQDGKE